MDVCIDSRSIYYATAVDFAKRHMIECQPLSNLHIYGQGRNHKKLPKTYILSSEERLIDDWVLGRRIGRSGQSSNLHEVVAFDLGLEALLGFRQGGGVKLLPWLEKHSSFTQLFQR